MNGFELIRGQTNNLLIEINGYINCLHLTPCPYTRNMLLTLLRQKISFLSFLNNLQYSLGVRQPDILPQQTFTVEQLSKYDGKNGQPAYIAVNGLVYDVTNSAAWAAATHFGLSAGRDLTREFLNCHQEQQQILNSLPVIGRLVQ
ncbi:MAG: cytochrome B5 [Firmicutes bacterium HGW-Firmicutes-14]|jgi:predicted heme/steroid binding protein|nr:MAG: cytochrome B5 [Firmicutes bacterium HGW-Firmicutes-14]